MKKHALRVMALLLLLVLTACEKPQPAPTPAPETVLPFTAPTQALLPFYCLGEDGCLWHVTRDGASSLLKPAEAAMGSRTFFFAREVNDGVIFASDFASSAGTDRCGVYHWADGVLTLLAQDVLYDSLRLCKDGSLLYIDSANTLYYRRGGMNHRIAEDVAQAEPVGKEAFIYRLRTGRYENGEFVYPIYSATVDYRNFLMDAAEIAVCDEASGRAFLLREKHTVQKRSAAAEVARCFICADGEILYEIPSVPLFQFADRQVPPALLSCREDQPTLVYRLYLPTDDLMLSVCENCVDGRIIGEDVFAFEKLEGNTLSIGVIRQQNKPDTVNTDQVSLKQLYSGREGVFAFFDGCLHEFRKGFPKVGENAASVIPADGAFLLLKEKSAPFTVMLYRDGQCVCLTDDAADERMMYRNGFLYYYTGEKGAYHLSLVDDRGRETAYISNVDDTIGFLAEGLTVAAAKMEDKTLYLAGPWGVVDTKLKIRRFI